MTSLLIARPPAVADPVDDAPGPVIDLTGGPALPPLPTLAPERPGTTTPLLVSAGWTIAGVTGAVVGGAGLAAAYQWMGARLLAVTVAAATAVL